MYLFKQGGEDLVEAAKLGLWTLASILNPFKVKKAKALNDAVGDKAKKSGFLKKLKNKLVLELRKHLKLKYKNVARSTRSEANKLSEVFGTGAEGAKKSLQALKDGKLDIPSDLTRQELLQYKDLALKTINKQRMRAKADPTPLRLEQAAKTDSVQRQRIQIIDRLLTRPES